ncbi:sulfur carrier protein ThiS [bacterium]|nr:sulfur carrier protein ThiS [bacterium]
MITVNNRDKLEWHDGMTIRDVLNSMKYNYSLIVVSVNGKPIHLDDYDILKIPDYADVKVIHIMHGG